MFGLLHECLGYLFLPSFVPLFLISDRVFFHVLSDFVDVHDFVTVISAETVVLFVDCVDRVVFDVVWYGTCGQVFEFQEVFYAVSKCFAEMSEFYNLYL